MKQKETLLYAHGGKVAAEIPGLLYPKENVTNYL